MAEKSSLLGTQIGKYRVDRLLGQGGMGDVYGAVHPRLGKRVAIKVLRAEHSANQDTVARFVNEAMAAAALDHAAIVEVFDYDQLADGRFYILMEHLQGEPLDVFLKREAPLDPGDALEILRPICDALDVAHAGGIVHRDLKPANIFLVRRPGAARQVKLLDFGVAKLRSGGNAAESTGEGVVMGTPQYMSPEQALGENERIGPKSDIYSLGVVAFSMLTGRLPFVGSSGALVVQHVHEPPPPLRTLRPALPEGLERVVSRALAKDPLDRWACCKDFAEAFGLALDSTATETLEALFAKRAEEAAARSDERTVPARLSSFTAGEGTRPKEVDRDDPLTTLSKIARHSRAGRERPHRWFELVLSGAVAATLTAGSLVVFGRHRDAARAPISEPAQPAEAKNVPEPGPLATALPPPPRAEATATPARPAARAPVQAGSPATAVATKESGLAVRARPRKGGAVTTRTTAEHGTRGTSLPKPPPGGTDDEFAPAPLQ